jgi:iron complex outermembrane receptor protein
VRQAPLEWRLTMTEHARDARMKRTFPLGATVLALGISLPSAAQQRSDLPDDLTQLSLEELMEVEVTTVARKKQDLGNTAAAIYVLSSEEIRSAGATSIPEALRLVPGLQVAQVDSSKWAVSSRGFNGLFANKMLVMIDGRSIYTPLFAGVFWDVQDLLLEDIDRIEVVRGPGATMWGSNAVNGVVNIITKPASRTQGAFVDTGVGTEDRGSVGLRFGGKAGASARYRVFGKGFYRDASMAASGGEGHDSWSFVSGGFRLDREPAGGHRFGLQASIYSGRTEQWVTDPKLEPPYVVSYIDQQDFTGGSLLGRWEKAMSAQSDIFLQASYERTSRRSDVRYRGVRDTSEVDAWYRRRAGDRHDLLFGGSLRYTVEGFENSFLITFDPARRGLYYASAFAEDEIALVPGRLQLTLGSRFEHGTFAGLEIQPNIRAAWTAGDHQMLWGSASRAVRSPSRGDRDLWFNVSAFPQPDGMVSVISVLGNDLFLSEELMAYEAGYRVQPLGRFSLDIAAFYNDYDRLAAFGEETPFLVSDPVYLALPHRITNGVDGFSRGLEIVSQVGLRENWKVSGWYSWLDVVLKFDPAQGLPTTGIGDSPNHQFLVRSQLDLPARVTLDGRVKYVGSLESVPAYTRVDIVTTWNLRPKLELMLAVFNLLDDHHPEFASDLVWSATEVQRSVLGKVSWQF